MKKVSINFNYDDWNIRIQDNVSDVRFFVTLENEEDNLPEILKQVKKLCQDGHIIDAAGDDSTGYTIDVSADAPNPLDEGDSAEHLLEIAKSIGYIKDYERFGFDFDIDYDAEL